MFIAGGHYLNAAVIEIISVLFGGVFVFGNAAIVRDDNSVKAAFSAVLCQQEQLREIASVCGSSMVDIAADHGKALFSASSAYFRSCSPTLLPLLSEGNSLA